jgi:hypothetical protein
VAVTVPVPPLAGAVNIPVVVIVPMVAVQVTELPVVAPGIAAVNCVVPLAATAAVAGDTIIEVAAGAVVVDDLAAPTPTQPDAQRAADATIHKIAKRRVSRRRFIIRLSLFPRSMFFMPYSR